MEEARTAVRDHFMGWQCRLRQLAVRQAGGRPTSGMRPHVRLTAAERPLGQITVLIVHRNPAEMTAHFRHIVRRTHDPAQRYHDALKALAAAHYQRHHEFSDEMTALFGAGSSLARRLLDARRCILEFEQYGQGYRLACAVRGLREEDPAFQATYWHNMMFTPAAPPQPTILGFLPDWASAEATPPIP